MSGKAGRPIGIGSTVGFVGKALSSAAKAAGGMIADGVNHAVLNSILDKAYQAGLEGKRPISFLSGDDRVDQLVTRAYDAGVRERHLQGGSSIHVTQSDIDQPPKSRLEEARAGRAYAVEPTGRIVDDPNLPDKKFPGKEARSHAGGMASTAVTLSYRSCEPLRVTSEVADWQGRSPEWLKAMKDHLERLKAQGVEAID